MISGMSIQTGLPILNDIINTFLLHVDTITISAIAIAIYAIVIWHYYRLLAKRDFFHFTGKTGKGFFIWLSNFFREIEFIAKYIIFYIGSVFIFFIWLC